MRKISLKKFNDDGYLIIKNFFKSTSIDDLLSEIHDLKLQKYETGIHPDKVKFQNYNKIKKIHSQCNVWKSNIKFKKIVCNKSLGKYASILMGWDGVKVNQYTLFTVSPGFGPTTFHQDNPYQDWHTSKGVITAIVALKPITKKMGCLIFVPDSHKWRSTKDRLSTSFIGSKNPLDDFNKAIKKNKIKNFDKEFIEMEVGDVSFHHGDLWHGSGINDSNEERLTLSIHFMQNNAKFKSKVNNPWFSRYKLKGNLEMHASFFPETWSNK